MKRTNTSFLSLLLLLLLAFAVLAWLALGSRAQTERARQISEDASLVHDVTEAVGGGGGSVVKVHEGANVYDEYGMNLHSVTDQTIGELRRLQQLRVEHLNLENRPVSDAGLRAIKGFNFLRTLDVSATLISDESVELIANLAQLETLDISGTRISDQNLSAFRRSKSLRRIFAGRTQISQKGFEWMIANCPGITIKRDVEIRGWGHDELPLEGRLRDGLTETPVVQH